MKKTDLINSIVEKTGMTKKDAGDALDAVTEAVVSSLSSGESVSLSGLGNFVVKDRKARQGRNPQTGETIQIAATKVVSFKPSSSLKEAVKS